MVPKHQPDEDLRSQPSHNAGPQRLEHPAHPPPNSNLKALSTVGNEVASTS
ncbi:hypothetical protein SAY86_028857 [Trapa natans]|uniref:Uncharacterized protein n=1 Tax=Trapa natans TaxID=22666 RepID=A0AAN7RES6_TRANT|nr:hypothetical protein SAY86_028857 [Trapa natans]